MRETHHYTNSNRAIAGFRCCKNPVDKKIDQVKEWLKNNDEFEFVKKDEKDCDYIFIKHNKCGNTIRKNIQKFFTSPDACVHCDTKSQKLQETLYDAQKTVDNIFHKQIQLIEYNGRHEKTKYRCMKCGQIFTQKFDCLLGSSGCPKCDKRQSQGEHFIKNLLLEHNVRFKEQVRAPELGRQQFDFGVYDDNDNLVYFIEVQGEQHYTAVSQWGGEEALRYRQELDKCKRNYCNTNNIPLYELVYRKKSFLNLDILPLGSTTIPAKGSTV